MVNKSHQKEQDNNTDSDNKEKVDSLLIAVKTNNLPTVRRILDGQPERIKQVWPDANLTALHVAASNGNSEIIEELLRRPGINPTLKDSWGRTALEIAMVFGRESAINLLFRATFPENYGRVDPLEENPPITNVLDIKPKV